MKITKDYLRKLISESLQEVTDLEAVGTEEAYGDDDSEEKEHVRGLLGKEREEHLYKIDMMLADLAVLESSLKQTYPNNTEVVQLIEKIKNSLDLLQGKIV